MKKFFLIVVLVVSANIGFAQDKYEFMTINYAASLNEIVISDGNTITKEKIQLTKDEKTDSNSNPLLQKTKEYQDKGWEVINFETYSEGQYGWTHYMCYLRKKKTN